MKVGLTILAVLQIGAIVFLGSCIGHVANAMRPVIEAIVRGDPPLPEALEPDQVDNWYDRLRDVDVSLKLGRLDVARGQVGDILHEMEAG
jgi:hypothetical protein